MGNKRILSDTFENSVESDVVGPQRSYNHRKSEQQELRDHRSGTYQFKNIRFSAKNGDHILRNDGGRGKFGGGAAGADTILVKNVLFGIDDASGGHDDGFGGGRGVCCVCMSAVT